MTVLKAKPAITLKYQLKLGLLFLMYKIGTLKTATSNTKRNILLLSK